MTARAGRELTRSIGWLMLSHVATLAVGFATAIIISRVGADELGRWRLAQAVTTYLLVGSDAGLTLLSIREVARRPGEVSRYAGPILVVRFLLALMAIAIGVAVVQPWNAGEAGWFYVAMFLTIVPAGLSLIHIVQGLQHMRTYALIRFITGALASALGLLAYVVTGSLVALVIPVVAIGSIVALGLAVYLHGARQVPLTAGRPSDWVHLASAGFPFLVGAISIQLISNADAVIIGALRGEAALGVYAAAYVFAGQLLFLSGPIAAVLYPRLAILHDRQGFARAVGEFTGVLGLLVVPACVGAALVAPSLIVIIYGPSYVESIPLLAILMGMPLVGFYNVAMSQALNAAHQHGTVARVAAVAAVVSVTLNLSLVGSVGAIAAAVVAVVTELVTAAAFTIALRSVVGLAPLRAYLSTLDAVLVMSGAVLALRAFDVALGFTILVGALVYTGVVFLRKPDSFRSAQRLLGR